MKSKQNTAFETALHDKSLPSYIRSKQSVALPIGICLLILLLLMGFSVLVVQKTHLSLNSAKASTKLPASSAATVSPPVKNSTLLLTPEAKALTAAFSFKPKDILKGSFVAASTQSIISGTPLDLLCHFTSLPGAAKPTLGLRQVFIGQTPQINKIGVFTAATSVNAVSIQAWGYSAGEAAFAFNNLQSAAASCLKSNVFVKNLPNLASRAFVVSSHLGTSFGTWIVFQSGDIIESVSFAANDFVNALYTSSRVSLFLINALHVQNCLSLTETVADHTRNPYDSTYQQYTKSILVSSPPLPAFSLPASQNTNAFSYPAVDDPSKLPAAPPAVQYYPTAPIFPADPTFSKIINVPILDSSGPGCGFVFSGLNIPSSNPIELTAKKTAAIDATQRDFSASAAMTLLARSDYAVSWQQFQNNLKAYNQYQAYLNAYNAAVVLKQQKLHPTPTLAPSSVSSPAPSSSPSPSVSASSPAAKSTPSPSLSNMPTPSPACPSSATGSSCSPATTGN